MNEPKPQHPLLVFEARYFKGWDQCMELWKKPDLPFEFRETILFRGLAAPFRDTPKNDDSKEYAERICFYLEIADGHLKTENFYNKNEFRLENFPFFSSAFGYLKEPQIRQLLAEKAFSVLCLNFFKGEEEKEDRAWVEDRCIERQVLFQRKELIEKILWFFRPSQSFSCTNIKNLTEYSDSEKENTHLLKIAKKFLLKLCELIWTSKHQFAEEIFKAVRPQTIKILTGLDQLFLLLQESWYEKINEECLEELNNLAMKETLWLPSGGDREAYSNETHRFPDSLEEACYGKSTPARILLLLNVILKEKKRFDELEKIRRQQREINKRMEVLKASKRK